MNVPFTSNDTVVGNAFSSASIASGTVVNAPAGPVSEAVPVAIGMVAEGAMSKWKKHEFKV